MDRYSRQIRFRPIGAEGQSRLSEARVLVVGCGALGSALADGLTRAGFGFIRLVDRDFLELNNLQRQHLYNERDLAEGLPKAEAAARALRLINSEIEIEAVVSDLSSANIHSLARDVHLILDGLDNFETRLLVNDYCLKHRLAWVYGGCIGSEGQCMTVLPGWTPCFRCLIENPPPAGSAATCETAGILSSASTMVAAFQLVEAIKLCVGALDRISRDLVVFDLWENTIRRLKLANLAAQGNCPACHQGRYEFLDGDAAAHTTTLCGRNAVQVKPPAGGVVDWPTLVERLRAAGPVTANRYLARLTIEDYEITLFPDARAIIKGTNDPAVARSLYARYVGA